MKNVWSVIQSLILASDKQMALHASGSGGISPHSKSFTDNSDGYSKTSYVTPIFCTNWVKWNVLPSLLGVLWCCQHWDNTRSKEPGAHTGAQLSRGWIKAKWLLKHFPWATSELISPAAFMRFFLVEGRFVRRLLEWLTGVTLDPGEGSPPVEPALRYFLWQTRLHTDIALHCFVCSSLVKLCGV